MRTRKPSTGDSVYLDAISVSSVLSIIFSHRIASVTVLEEIPPTHNILRWVLQLRGIEVNEIEFFTGHLRTESGESVFLQAQSLSSTISFDAAKRIVTSNHHLSFIDKKYGRKTIQLYIARQLYVHINYWTVRALVAKNLNGAKQSNKIWIMKPRLFDEDLISNSFPDICFKFYPVLKFPFLSLLWLASIDYLRYIKLLYWGCWRNDCDNILRPGKPGVLLLQEDNIRKEHKLRGQPHWFDYNDSPEYEVSLLSFKGSKFDVIDGADEFFGTGVAILPMSSLRLALRESGGDERIKSIVCDLRKLYGSIFRLDEYSGKYFSLKVASLLRQAELMGAMAIWRNIKLFLIRETYYSLSDAMQLVAPSIGVTTVAYQYSNLGMISPNMMSTADNFLVFSDMYKELFKVGGIGPQDFKVTGYLYDDISNLVSERSKKHRDNLIKAGASFIVCYFDESVQNDRWGLVDKNDHLIELHLLANIVLSDPKFAVVLKSQFIRNSPSQLYNEDILIESAIATGRFLELMEGVHRNDIYPTEAALIADLCISHKFGATAGLEAAIAGVRTVLLDTHGVRTSWDSLYSTVDIQYDSFEALMNSVDRYRSGSPENEGLGDWEPILHHFDSFRDGEAVKRLRSLVDDRIEHGVKNVN